MSDYRISGSVQLQGTPVSGSVVRLVNQTTDELVSSSFTDNSGSFDLLLLSEYEPFDDLLHYYPSDETTGTNVEDVIGGNDGTANNSRVIGSVSGQINGGLDFSQGVDNVTINFSPSFTNLNKTISLWAYPVDTTTNGYLFSGLNSGGAGNSFTLIWYPDSGNNGFAGLLGGTGVASSAVESINEWHHVVVTNDGSTNILYVDGNFINSSGGASTSVTITSAKIGVANNANASPFNGYIDEPCIFNRPLTSGEVSDLYNKQLNHQQQPGDTVINPTDDFHVTCEYQSGSLDYQSLSYPYVKPVEII